MAAPAANVEGEAAPPAAAAATATTTLAPTAPPAKLRHGRKPMYDSDAEADGLNPDVDDEELERGITPSEGATENDALLSRPASGTAQLVPFTQAPLTHLRQRWDDMRGARTRAGIRRGKRRDTAGASRRSSRGNGAPPPGSFAAFRAEHPTLMRAVYALLALIGFVLLLLAVALIHLFSVTLKAPSPDAQALILDQSLLLRGPDAISLLNISDEGISIRVDGRLGIDPDRALDLWLGDKKQQSWWRRKDRSIVEWAVGKVGGVRVELGELRFAEPDWSLPLDEKHLGLIGDGKASSELVSKKKPSKPDGPPQDLLSFHISPIIVPLPALRGSARSHKLTGDNSSHRAHEELRTLNLTLLLKPVSPAPYLLEVGKRAIKDRKAILDIKVASLRVRGLGVKELARGEVKGGRWNLPGWINIGENDIRKRISEKIPYKKGKNDTKNLLDLKRYDFFEIGADAALAFAGRALGIRAFAEAKNPLGKMLHGHVGYSLPFGAFLPLEKGIDDGEELAPLAKANDSALLAVIATNPFDITGSPNISLTLEGRVVPPTDGIGFAPSTSAAASVEHSDASEQLVLANKRDQVRTLQTPAQAALSNFLSRFLRGDANTVYVRGGSPFPPSEVDPTMPGAGSKLPEWLEGALRLVDLPISFPGSKVTDLIRNVTISDLKITPHPFEKEKLLCSGTVMGEMALPGQLATIDVQITHLWPDILVFDGKPPSMRHHGDDGDDDEDEDIVQRRSQHVKDGPTPPKVPDEPEPAPPLPSPLPKHAFGRVRPHNWTVATTYLDPSDPKKQRKLLRSELKNVPFTVLDGRGKEFRAFSWKIVTGEGALAGIEGKAQAKIWNSGLGALVLKNLPVKGAFMVGKRGGDDGDEEAWTHSLSRWASKLF